MRLSSSRSLSAAVLLVGLTGLARAGQAPAGQAPAAPGRVSPARERVIRQALLQPPLRFEENRGQADPRVRFTSRAPGYSLFLTADEAVLSLSPASSDRGGLRPAALRFRLVGSRPQPRVQGTEPLPGRSNYFRGNNPAKWVTDVPSWAKVWYPEVYPGIDLIYYGQGQELEHDFLVSPGADPGRIRMAFAGVQDTLIAGKRTRGARLDASGDLVLRTAAGDVRQRRPVAYQLAGTVREPVAAEYLLDTEAGAVSFRVGEYDRGRPLVIDPVLVYSTYLGTPTFTTGSVTRGQEDINGIAVGADGSAYVTGSTTSNAFPTTAGAFQEKSLITNPRFGSHYFEAFVVKLAPTGSTLVYSTYLSGDEGSRATAIAVDAQGSAYITGYTTTRYFPTTVGAFQREYQGATDTFVTKLHPTGSGLAYSTFINGSQFDEAQDIAVDGAGRAYVVGNTISRDLPVTPNAYDRTYNETLPSYGEIFIAALNPTGSGLVYCTYLGASQYDSATAMVVDSTGSVVVTGGTNSPDFPTVRALQSAFGFGFVTKLDPTGSFLVFSTFLNAGPRAVAADGGDNIWLTGTTGLDGIPTTGDAFSREGEGFLLSLDAVGALRYGARFSATPAALAVDPERSVYVTGTPGTAFPRVNPLQTQLTGPFVLKMARDGGLIYSTPFGGSGGGLASCIAVTPTGDAFVGGDTSSESFPTTPGAYQRTLAGGSDGFIARINSVTGPKPAAPSVLRAEAVLGTQIDLTWTDNSTNETAFEVQRKSTGGFATIAWPGANATLYSDTKLQPLTLYTYRVRAVNDGGFSGYSNEASAMSGEAPPNAPSSLQASIVSGTHHVIISWRDRADNETGFEIQRKTTGEFARIATTGADVTFYRDTTVLPLTSYTYRVRAMKNISASGWSNEREITTPRAAPLAPSNLSATVLLATQVELRWQDNSSGGYQEDSFQVERKSGAGSFQVIGAVGSDTTRFPDSGLAAGTTYTYRVRGISTYGNSDYSNEASATTSGGAVPASPSDLLATAISTSHIELTWKDNSDNEAGFEVERKSTGEFARIARPAANTTSYGDTGLEANTLYTYQTRSVNESGASAYSNEASATSLPVAPAAPGNLLAIADSSVRIDLTWRDNSDNETGFKIERKSGAAEFSLLTTVAAGTAAHADTGLLPGTRYTYRVRATNAGGHSEPSNEASATTLVEAPAAPTELTARAVTETQINLEWRDNSSGGSQEDNSEIERKTGDATFQRLASVARDATRFADTGLAPGTTYTYRVRATNAGGNSDYSNEVSATTPGGASLRPPDLILATPVTAFRIDLTWRDTNDDETGFRIERRTDATAFVEVWRAPAGSGGGYADGGLQPNTLYTYRVIALGNGRVSPPSNEHSAITFEIAPAAPSGLAATAVGSSRIDLSWRDDGSGTSQEKNFGIERKTGSGEFHFVSFVSADTTRYSDTGLAAGTTYTYRVLASTDTGNSAYSNEASATTQGAAVTLQSLTVSPARVRGGKPATGTVTLSGPAPAGGTIVALKSNSAKVTVPAEVTVPAGQTSASFTITTRRVFAAVRATLTARLGDVAKTVRLTVTRR